MNEEMIISMFIKTTKNPPTAVPRSAIMLGDDSGWEFVKASFGPATVQMDEKGKKFYVVAGQAVYKKV